MGRLLRTLGFGRYVPRQTEVIERGEALFALDAVRCTASARKLRLRGQVASRASSWHVGAVVLSPEFVLASVTRSLLLVAVPWGPVPEDAPGRADLEENGLHVVFFVDRVVPGGRGVLRFDYAFTPSSAVLAALPVRSAPLPIEADGLLRLARSMLGG